MAFSFFVICLAIGLLIIFPPMEARLFGVKTQGTVQGLAVCQSDDDSGGDDVALLGVSQVDFADNVQPTIQFTDLKGQSHSVVDLICGTYGVGEQVTLWYSPNNPNAFAVDQDTIWNALFSALGALLVLVALWALLASLRRFLFRPVTVPQAANRGQVYPAYVGSQAQMGGWQMNSPPQAWPSPMGGAAPFGAGLNHRVGELVSVAGQWAITVTNASSTQGTAMVSAPPGRYYLLLALALRNISSESVSFSQTTFRLADSVGAEYQRAPILEGTPPGFIQPGAQVTATLAYEAPAALRQFRLSFYLPTSSLAQATWDIAI